MPIIQFIDGVKFVWSCMASISTSSSSVNFNLRNGLSVKLRKMINNFANKTKRKKERKKAKKGRV